ncbi:lytic murein transglycosylase [Patescibacteria group bacterium]|nr:lytic murein transglycosylase [Patescibacteria group bacterium]
MLKICSKHKKVIAFTVITFLFLSGWLNFQSDILDGSYAKAVSDGAKADLENKRVQLEAEIAELRREIDGLKIQVGQKESEKKNLKKEVDILNGKIKAIELEIKTTELETERLSFEIDSTEEKIKAKEENLLKQKDFLVELMRALYLSDNKSLTEVLLEYDRLSDFWDEFQKNEALQENIKDTIENIKTSKQELENNRTKLLDEQEEKNYFLELKENQNRDLAVNKKTKQGILTLTANEQKELQKQLEKEEKLLPAMIAQLRSLDIAGQVINADAAITAAKFASQATGVRPAYLLGILKVETNLGANLGSGYYQTDMRPSQQPTFLEIIKELGLPETVPVSKRPKTYSGWGGAMGPAQMMPTTWVAYKDGVTSITGNNPPNPWDIKDAVVAMALKVSRIPGVVGANFNSEYEAAARYFAGSNWQKFTWYAKNSSGTGVMDWAEKYEQLLKGG